MWWKTLVRYASLRSRLIARQPRYAASGDGGAITVVAPASTRSTPPQHPAAAYCHLQPPKIYGPHRTRCKRSPAYNRRHRCRRSFSHPPPTHRRSLRYRLAQLSLVRTPRPLQHSYRRVFFIFVFLISHCLFPVPIRYFHFDDFEEEMYD